MTRTKKQTHNGDERAALILELFRQLPDNKFSLRHLASASGGASKEGRRETMQIVEQLLATGVIESCPRDKYRLSPAQRPRLEGTVEMLNTGSMFVHVEGMEQQVYIHSRNSLNALDGDRVQLVLTRKARGSNAPEGEITAIVERSRKRYVGTAEVNEHNVFVRIDSRKMPVDVYLHKRDCPNVKNGDKVVVRIAEWAPGSKSPVGELVDILGKAGENDTEMHAILAEYDLPYRFEPEVEAAAEAIDGRITRKDYAERRDFRQTVTFTVDPADAKDFDDALSVRKVRDGVWEVGVHIADVTHYVRPGSVVDTEAEARGTSVYLVDRTVPMLPERLCNELCSLRPHEESLCFSAVFTLNENLEILDEWFGRTVIYSDRRFAYEEAQQVIETGRGDYAEEILTLNRLAQAMRRERFRNGAISFDRAEAKFRLDEKGRPLGVYFKEQKEANQMIEEFMLLANRRVAEFCGKVKGRKSGRTMVYRVHDEPNVDKLQSFRQFILRFGHVFKASEGRPVAKEMNKLFQKVKGRPEENVVTTLAVRSMAKAYYHRQHRPLRTGLPLLHPLHFADPPLSRHDGAPPAGTLPRRRQDDRQGGIRSAVRARLGTRSDRRRGRTRLYQIQDGGVHAGTPGRGVRRPHIGHHRVGHLRRDRREPHRRAGGHARHARRFLRLRSGRIHRDGPLDGPALHAGRCRAHPRQARRSAKTPARLRHGATRRTPHRHPAARPPEPAGKTPPLT